MYIYHIKPQNLKGDTLYPLYALEKSQPEVYEQARKKYEGREFVMQKHLACLNCRWNDVLHFSPISPHHIFKAYQDAGGKLPQKLEWYQVPIDAVSHLPTAWFTSPPDKTQTIIGEEHCHFLDWAKYEELSVVPQATTEYYKECFEAKRPPLLYVGVPHVLVKGPVPIKNDWLESF